MLTVYLYFCSVLLHAAMAVNSTVDCPAYSSPFDNEALVPTLSVAHSITWLALAASARLLHQRVEIGHPVFAVIFQEVVVLLIIETVAVVLLFTMLLEELEVLALMFLLLMRSALQFHPCTWVIITYLRQVIADLVAHGSLYFLW